MMKHSIIALRKGLQFLPLAVFALVLAGCANAKPLDRPVTADSMPEGPGLFTGESGEFSFSLFGDKSNDDGRRRDRSTGSSTSGGTVYGQDEGQM